MEFGGFHENDFFEILNSNDFGTRVVLEPETLSTQTGVNHTDLYKDMVFRHQNPMLRLKTMFFLPFFSKTKVLFTIYSPQAH